MKSTRWPKVLVLLPLVACSAALYAHEGHGHHALRDGLAHPFTGLDHILALLAVGLWAAQLGGRALWMVPGIFVGVMGVGGLLGFSRIAIPMGLVESGILASVLVLGLLLATATKMPHWASGMLVSAFALCHGFAHGYECAGDSFAAYGTGFASATACLQAGGIVLGWMAQRIKKPLLLRAAGTAMVLLSFCLWAGWL